MCGVPTAEGAGTERTERFRPTACVLSNAALRDPTVVHGIRSSVCVLAAPLANVQPVVYNANLQSCEPRLTYQTSSFAR